MNDNPRIEKKPTNPWMIIGWIILAIIVLPIVMCTGVATMVAGSRVADNRAEYSAKHEKEEASKQQQEANDLLDEKEY